LLSAEQTRSVSEVSHSFPRIPFPFILGISLSHLISGFFKMRKKVFRWRETFYF
jgi:hypothetical protein